jgi:lysophospholipase L1-like esterase
MTRCLGAVLAVTLLLGSSAAAAPPQSLRVLFVGNSLTATNDLPAHVAGLADASGRKLEYRTIAVGGYSLEDHWNLGEARKALATRSWDVVVMQQGPSALPESQTNLRAWAIRFADEARSKGTRPALLTVWPESYRQSALAEVITSYRRAAEAAGAELLPAGVAWQAAWRCDRRLPLYGGDGFHPSPVGTYAAALVIYGRLFRAPLQTRQLELVGLPSRTSRLLQATAARALGRHVPPARRCGRP